MALDTPLDERPTQQYHMSSVKSILFSGEKMHNHDNLTNNQKLMKLQYAQIQDYGSRIELL